MKIVKPSTIQQSFNGFNLSIEYAETNDKKVYLLVLRSMTKIIFNGTITAKSRIRKIPEKANKN